MSWHHGKHCFLALLLLSAPASFGCGDDDDGGGDGERYEGCDARIPAGSTTEQIQEIFINATDGQTLCFEDGTYTVTRELSIGLNDVTVQGNPKDRSAVVLDYAAQTEGKDALKATGDGFTIQHLSIKNSSGNTIVTDNVDRVTFRNLKVSWDDGSVTTNGAYAVYPLSSTNVLVEDCEVTGASDAGIYVGQSSNIIVRNNNVYGNVAGIEIENSDSALVTGNDVHGNTAGILVFVLPHLEKTSGSGTIVENNQVRDNNHANFGQPGTTVSFVPAGTGMLVLANDNTEVRGNTITGNTTTGVLALSYQTFGLICSSMGGSNCGVENIDSDPYLSKLYIHDNTFEGNGTAPDPLVSLLLGPELPNVLWDGITQPDAPTEQLCLGEAPTTILQFDLSDEMSPPVTDASLFSCSLPAPFETITLPQGS